MDDSAMTTSINITLYDDERAILLMLLNRVVTGLEQEIKELEKRENELLGELYKKYGSDFSYSELSKTPEWIVLHDEYFKKKQMLDKLKYIIYKIRGEVSWV